MCVCVWQTEPRSGGVNNHATEIWVKSRTDREGLSNVEMRTQNNINLMPFQWVKYERRVENVRWLEVTPNKLFRKCFEEEIAPRREERPRRAELGVAAAEILI